MPFIHVKVAGEPLTAGQTEKLQKGITSLMVSELNKVGSLVGVLIEEVPAPRWSVGGESIRRAAQIDAVISAGTNTADEKANFIDQAYQLTKSVLGTALSPITYIVIHEVSRDSWGYGGLTQEARSRGNPKG